MAPASPDNVRSFTVAEDDDGIRLDRWFKRHLPDTSFNIVSRWARTGQLRIDGKRVAPGDRVATGQVLRVPPAEPATAEGPGGRPQRIVEPLTEEETAYVQDMARRAVDPVGTERRAQRAMDRRAAVDQGPVAIENREAAHFFFGGGRLAGAAGAPSRRRRAAPPLPGAAVRAGAPLLGGLLDPRGAGSDPRARRSPLRALRAVLAAEATRLALVASDLAGSGVSSGNISPASCSNPSVARLSAKCGGNSAR